MIHEIGERIATFLQDPSSRYKSLARRGLYKNMSDEDFIRKQFKLELGYDLDLEHPKTFNEKLQWLKLHDRKPIYTTMVDKYAVKEYVASIIGDKYIVPLLGVWDRFEDIDFDSLPNQFVIKCTHDSGGLVIVKDKQALDVRAAQKKISRALKSNYFHLGREWAYKDVKPKIIAEQYLEDESHGLIDYKVLCFGGIPKLVEVHKGRYTDEHSQDFYDVNWELQPFNQIGEHNAAVPEKKPPFLDEMLKLSAILAGDMAHIRIDWYYTNNQLYFGEYTFFDASGFDDFEPNEANLLLGSWIHLPCDK